MPLIRSFTAIRPSFKQFTLMSSRPMSDFRVIEHVTRAQHSRNRFAGAELGRENDLRMHVKQYIPTSNPHPKPGDVTIIGAVADAFPKEMLEPLWSIFHQQLQSQGHNIRSIWIADPANQGHSGVINEKILGPDPSWYDHGLDLLFLINQFQDEMPHPLVGIGHSMGAGHLLHLSLLHPRLLHSLVLMDPVFSRKTAGTLWAAQSVDRRDLWTSRSAAAAKMRSNRAFQAWDEGVLDQYIEYGLRDLPTEMYPEMPVDTDADDPPVTLQTTKAQEQYNYIRAAYHDDRYLLQDGELWQDFHPEDIEPDIGLFSRAENKIFHRRLPELRPSVLYVVGEKSEVSTADSRRNRMEITGSGTNGSGGAKKGRVQEVALDCGHLVPFERPKEAARACAAFVGAELDRWGTEEKSRRERWERLSRKERVDINDLWRKNIGAKRKETGKL